MDSQGWWTSVRRAVPRAALAGALAAVALAAPAPAQIRAASAADESEALYLVTLSGPGVTGDRGRLAGSAVRTRLLAQQDDVLSTAGAETEPVYRWTDALNGFAAPLTTDEARAVAAQPGVELVEQNAVRRLAAAPEPRAPGTSAARSRGGAGVVIGVVDSGIWPESPLFAEVPGLGRQARGFHGACQAGAGWTPDTCNRKIEAARWFVDGFGTGNLSGAASLSPRDESGHGTQVASIAAGNTGVSVQSSGEPMGTFSGIAPQARLAVYKACWTAPDPDADGCATADLVAAVDQAVQDGVDVLNVSVSGPASLDTVERALLGAAEADVVVVGAAGNTGRSAYAAHASPWVTSVGAATAAVPRGEVRVAGGPRLEGTMVSGRTVPRARIVLGARAAAPGSAREDAALCRPGSLGAGVVSGAIVVCQRGAIGRVDKSAAVEQAGGAGMVLVNMAGGGLAVDVHAVPTVHVDRDGSRLLSPWLARHPGARARLTPVDTDQAPSRVVRWSSGGDPASALVKPDLVGPGVGRLGAVPPGPGDNRFAFFSGTSAATAHVGGIAALLLSRHDWSASAVRSALTTSGRAVPGPALRQGGGRSSIGAALRARLVLEVGRGDYRRFLEGRLAPERLNTPSILLDRDSAVVTRRVTNLGRRAMYYSSATRGFARSRVQVTPLALRIPPGGSRTFRVTVSSPGGVSPLDDGYVVWRGADGTRLRMPVVLSR